MTHSSLMIWMGVPLCEVPAQRQAADTFVRRLVAEILGEEAEAAARREHELGRLGVLGTVVLPVLGGDGELLVGGAAACTQGGIRDVRLDGRGLGGGRWRRVPHIGRRLLDHGLIDDGLCILVDGRVDVLVDGRVDVLVDGGVGVLVDDGVDVLVDGRVDVLVDGGVGVLVDGGVGILVDGGVDVLVDGGVGILVDGRVDVLVDGGVDVLVDGGVGVLVDGGLVGSGLLAFAVLVSGLLLTALVGLSLLVLVGEVLVESVLDGSAEGVDELALLGEHRRRETQEQGHAGGK
jgi:hypothetical protein